MSVTTPHRKVPAPARSLLLGAALLTLLSAPRPLRAAEPAEQPPADPPPALAAPLPPPLSQPAPPPPVEPPPAGEAPDATRAAESPDEQVARSVELFKQERYAEAGQAMEAAYALRPRPIYLFNAAQAYRRAARPREAIVAYRRFLTVAPDAPQASEAAGHLKNMEQLVAAEVRASTETANRRALAITAARTQADLLLARARAAEERRRARRRAGIIGGAVGAVAVGLAVTIPLLLTREPSTDWGFHMVTF